MRRASSAARVILTARGLGDSFVCYQRMIQALDGHCHPRSRVLGEPQLGRRGLYPSLSVKGSTAPVRILLDLISMADGRTALVDIADACGVPVWQLAAMLERLCDAGVLAREGVLPA